MKTYPINTGINRILDHSLEAVSAPLEDLIQILDGLHKQSSHTDNLHLVGKQCSTLLTATREHEGVVILVEVIALVVATEATAAMVIIIIIIIIYSSTDHLLGNNTWMGDDGRDDDVIRAYQGLINIYMAKPRNARYRAFEEKVAEYNTQVNNIKTDPEEVIS